MKVSILSSTVVRMGLSSKYANAKLLHINRDGSAKKGTTPNAWRNFIFNWAWGM